MFSISLTGIIHSGVKLVYAACLISQLWILGATGFFYALVEHKTLPRILYVLHNVLWGAALAYRAFKINFASQTSLYVEYMFAWKVFYATYLCTIWL